MLVSQMGQSQLRAALHYPFNTMAGHFKTQEGAWETQGPPSSGPLTSEPTTYAGLSDFDFNRFWLHLFGLRKMQTQDAVLVFGLDPALID